MGVALRPRWTALTESTGVDSPPRPPSAWRHHRAVAEGACQQVQLREDDLPQVLCSSVSVSRSTAKSRSAVSGLGRGAMGQSWQWICMLTNSPARPERLTAESASAATQTSSARRRRSSKGRWNGGAGMAASWVLGYHFQRLKLSRPVGTSLDTRTEWNALHSDFMSWSLNWMSLGRVTMRSGGPSKRWTLDYCLQRWIKSLWTLQLLSPNHWVSSPHYLDHDCGLMPENLNTYILMHPI